MFSLGAVSLEGLGRVWDWRLPAAPWSAPDPCPSMGTSAQPRGLGSALGFGQPALEKLILCCLQRPGTGTEVTAAQLQGKGHGLYINSNHTGLGWDGWGCRHLSSVVSCSGAERKGIPLLA